MGKLTEYFGVFLLAFRFKIPKIFLLAPSALAIGPISCYGRGRAKKKTHSLARAIDAIYFFDLLNTCLLYFLPPNHFSAYCELVHVYGVVIYIMDP